MKKPPAGIRIAVQLGDIHCGSTLGLLPPDFLTLEQNTVRQNAAQRWLWECWQDVLKRLYAYVGTDAFALILAGDLIEGVHHGGKQTISVDTRDHSNAAEKVLKPLAAKAAKVFVVEGTECHTQTSEVSLAKTLDGVPDPDTGKAVWERLTLTIAGCRYVVFHHITPTTREYLKGSGLSITLGNEQLAAAKNGEPVPQVVGCGHRHDYDQFQDATGLIFVTPSWQLKTRHGQKVVPAARTKVGLVVLDWRDKSDGSLPHVEPILCRAPAAKGAAV